MVAAYNEAPWRYFHAPGGTAQAGVTIKSGQGILHTVVVNNPGSAGTLSLSDGGTAFMSVAATVAGTSTFDLGFANNLVITTGGTTAPDVTVTFL